MGYKITVYTNYLPITEIFNGRNLNSRLARWYLTIQAYSPEIKYTKGRQNVMADASSKNVYVGCVAHPLFQYGRLLFRSAGTSPLGEGNLCFGIGR